MIGETLEASTQIYINKSKIPFNYSVIIKTILLKIIKSVGFSFGESFNCRNLPKEDCFNPLEKYFGHDISLPES